MSDLPPKTNRYAMAALRERRAEMSGELARLERQVRHIEASMVHLDATLRHPNIVPEAIPSKRPYVRAKLFGANKLNQLILDASGAAPGPCPRAKSRTGSWPNWAMETTPAGSGAACGQAC